MTIPADNFYTNRPVENVLRGALFSLIAIPVGAFVWVLIWNLGFVASIVSFATAFAAVWLYRKGSGGIVGIPGVIVIAAVVLVTVLLGFWAGMVTDYIKYVTEQTGLSAGDVFTNPAFWPAFNEDFPAVFSAYVPQLLLALLFAALGAGSTLIRVFRAAKAQQAAVTVDPAAAYPPPANPAAAYPPAANPTAAYPPAEYPPAANPAYPPASNPTTAYPPAANPVYPPMPSNSALPAFPVAPPAATTPDEKA